MENERHIARKLLDSGKRLKAKSLPVGGIFAVDIADSCGKHRNAEVGDLLALGIRALTHTYYAVLFSADGAYLSLKRHSLFLANGNQLLGLGDVLVNGIV